MRDSQRCPISGKQFVDPVDLVIVDAMEEIGDVGLEVEGIDFGAFDERHGPGEDVYFFHF